MIKKRNIHPDTLTQDLGQWLCYNMTAGAANAFAFAIQNPYSDKDLIIDEVVLRITTAGGTGASVLNVDVAPTATDTGDTIFDGVDLNSTGLFSSNNVTDSGTNGDEKPHLWNAAGGTNDYLTGKILDKNATDLVGKVYIHVIQAQ